jgi:hypothetical protein
VGDLADFCFIQSRPTFDERGKALSPTVARARFDAQVVIEVAQMNDDGLNARTASLKRCVRAAMSVGSLIRFGAG